ncbi:hypothetical protein ACQP1G_15390 [Nocardia sp. CA-107356]|uniref:hypothetical protein n=1 Tax=Nocardia sp. CA-107356 TaxID=3239972 RepID=UPI003D8F087B
MVCSRVVGAARSTAPRTARRTVVGEILGRPEPIGQQRRHDDRDTHRTAIWAVVASETTSPTV